ncbi:PrpF protein [Lentinula aciculospora]|uniref:PrpF protein n=1 Tax=Lentinula aciculospora TaxID=153920 RepID=A0A9W9DX06_9AGAR|nr:PrpF protein [Lentinula aciculospora]
MNLATSAFQRGSPFARTIPATFLRGGTSKGIFLQQSHLPQDKSEWNEIFLGLMGSPDAEYGRQLNGMGGGVSSLSKICVVQPASVEQRRLLGVDVEYTFVQVGIRDSAIDYSGNCGNLSSMIGVFALDEGMVDNSFTENHFSVRAFNTNTQKVVNTAFPIDRKSGLADLSLPETRIAGVSGEASQIQLDFYRPSGARTGKLLPTGAPMIQLEITKGAFHMSLVDATNPTVFVDRVEIINASSTEDPSSHEQLRLLEVLRREGAIRMGLDPNVQAQPKIAMVSSPNANDDEADIEIIALSMGVPHKAVPMTVGLCLGVAANTQNTLPYTLARRIPVHNASRSQFVKLRHPGGVVEVGATFDANGEVESASVIRTGRRLMKGHVWY